MLPLVVRRASDEDAPSQASTEEDLPDQTSIPSPPPSPPPPPRASTSRQLPPRKAIPVFSATSPTHQQTTQLSTSAPAASSIHQRVQSHRNLIASQPTVILSKYASMQSNAVASTSKRTLASPEAPKVSGFRGDTMSSGLMSPPSTQASESSIRTVVAQRYPEVGAALEDSTHRRRKSVKKYVEREHIHAKQVRNPCGRACAGGAMTDGRRSIKRACRRRRSEQGRRWRRTCRSCTTSSALQGLTQILTLSGVSNTQHALLMRLLRHRVRLVELPSSA